MELQPYSSGGGERRAARGYHGALPASGPAGPLGPYDLVELLEHLRRKHSLGWLSRAPFKTPYGIHTVAQKPPQEGEVLARRRWKQQGGLGSTHGSGCSSCRSLSHHVSGYSDGWVVHAAVRI